MRMKKTLFIVLLSMFSIEVFSEELNLPSLFNSTPLVLDGLDKNIGLLKSEITPLSDEQRFMLYQIHKKNPWEGLALNLLVGFGSGSFYQGDSTGGVWLLGGDILGVLLTSIGISVNVDTARSEWSSNSMNGSQGTPAIVTGIVLLSAVRIAGTVLPFIHSKNYNRKLLDVLSGHIIIP
jgi:hypothetical protein